MRFLASRTFMHLLMKFSITLTVFLPGSDRILFFSSSRLITILSMLALENFFPHFSHFHTFSSSLSGITGPFEKKINN